MVALREYRRRIRSVGGIQQITRAMEMVAVTKLRRFQGKAVAARPYTRDLERMLAHVAPLAGEAGRSPLFQPRAAGGPGVLLVTSDRGLCGPYNANLFEEARRFLEEKSGVRPRFYVYGRKGYAWLTRRGHEVARYFVDPPLERVDFHAARLVVKELVSAFLGGEIAELFIVATPFVSMFANRPFRIRMLPVTPADLLGGVAGEAEEAREVEYLLEPDAQTIFDRLVPKVLETKMHHLLLEALTAEYASRRVAMKNATEAAEEMRADLARLYNRARQERITRELLEIVSGAEALRRQG